MSDQLIVTNWVTRLFVRSHLKEPSDFSSRADEATLSAWRRNTETGTLWDCWFLGRGWYILFALLIHWLVAPSKLYIHIYIYIICRITFWNCLEYHMECHCVPVFYGNVLLYAMICHGNCIWYSRFYISIFIHYNKYILFPSLLRWPTVRTEDLSGMLSMTRTYL